MEIVDIYVDTQIQLAELLSGTNVSKCKILGFHGGDYEEWCLLGCYAMWLL
jgi:hypothetical protein